MPRLLHILSSLLFFCTIFGAVQASGQCVDPVPGVVVEISCGKAFLDFNASFQVRVPVGNPFDGIEAGTEVMVDRELTGDFDCGQLEVIEISCVETLNVPPSNCDANFLHSESFDGAPTVVFEPITLYTDAEYFWDFGDDTYSSEMTPVHEYAEQGVYQVCLTLDGGNCTGETSCKILDLNECHAAFSHETTEDGLVEFYDFSEGNFTEWEWKMGDGSVFTNEVVDTHAYNGVDIYTVCLTVWNDNGCSHEYCDYVFTGTGDLCEFSDCVLPGDTDIDQTANVYDLLPIGVAFGSEGPPRSLGDEINNPSLIWEPQYSPNWGLQTIAGIDYKHIDCDGDGVIGESDMEAIEENYLPPGDIFQVTADGQPYFWLEFDFDTVVIDDSTPAFFTLEADLMAGAPDLPFDDLRGFAMQLDYPEDMILEGNGVEINYNDNSFFGSTNNVLSMDRNRGDVGVMDVGFTRKGSTGTGFGKVADLSFIVIADVIARGSSAEPFTITLDGVIAVNQAGAKLTLDQPDESPTVIILNKTTTDTKTEILNRQVGVFPNPASNHVWVTTSELDGQSIEVFNTFGQQLEEHTVTSNQTQLNVSAWPAGVYILHVHTDKGTAKKRVVVE